jgi:hypothetical protein
MWFGLSLLGCSIVRFRMNQFLHKQQKSPNHVLTIRRSFYCGNVPKELITPTGTTAGSRTWFDEFCCFDDAFVSQYFSQKS